MAKKKPPAGSLVHTGRYHLTLIAVPDGSDRSALMERAIEELKYQEATGTHNAWIVQAIAEKVARSQSIEDSAAQ